MESKKRYKSTYLHNVNKLTDIENKFTLTKGERGGSINWKFGINLYTILLYINMYYMFI